MDKDKLKEILEKHEKWLNGQEGGERAVLWHADLKHVILSHANLRYANLDCTNLDGADLSYTDLHGASLCGAHLYGVDLNFAKLNFANLYGVNLYNANLSYANLDYANLDYASLFSANLYEVNFRGASMRYADLRRADLFRATIHAANLCGANLSEAKNVPFIPLVCPSEGAFTGWKKGLIFDNTTLDVPFGVIIELEIPADAKRSSATDRKCRCDKALVKSITSLDGSKSFDIAYSKYDFSFAYKVGEMVSVNNFEEDRFKECAPGIHFFIERQEAVNYPDY